MPFKVQVGPHQISIHQGQTVLISEPDGQINSPSERGLYFFDTRVISTWAIYANGEPWDLLNGGAITYFAWRADRWTEVVCALLIGVSKFDELWFTPGSTQELDAYGESGGREASRNHNGGQAGVGGKSAIGAQLCFAYQIRLAADRRIGKGLHAIVGHRLQDRLTQGLAFEPVLQVFFGVTRIGGLRIVQVILHGGMEFP